MGSEWKIKKVKDVVLQKITKGTTPTTIGYKFEERGINFLRAENIVERSISGELKKISTECHSNMSRSQLKENDILITIAGTIGRISIVNAVDLPLNINQAIAIIRANNEIVDTNFLYYSFKSRKVASQVFGNTRTTAQPNLNMTDLGNIELSVPPLSTQKKIAHILSTLDDKIELNRKMNETLEAMAHSLFKSWFVDFEPVHAKAKAESEQELEAAAAKLGIAKEILDLFPSEFEESEMGIIPKGWKIEQMQNIFSVKDGTHDSPKPQEVGYPLVTSKHIKNGEIELETPKLISKEDFEKVNQRSKVQQYDILIGMIGTIGDLYLVSDDEINYAIKNIGLFKTSETKKLSEYVYYWLDTSIMRNYIISRLAGTTQKYISLTELRKLPLLVPTEEVVEAFKDLVSNMLSIKNLNFQNSKELQAIRDILLPKLLSGELDVSKIEQDIE
jgi:type I restriction enzyme S subunit